VNRAFDRERLKAWAPFAMITAVGLWALWPAPLGVMPLSADHPVHLTRAWMLAQTLGKLQLHGWSTTWFVGAPVGDLYPVLGDLLVIAMRAITLGWERGYALAFTLVFVFQGWALLRVGRAFGLGALPGLIAGLLCLLDLGSYREGGWIYTVHYGVWPQTLATSLVWLGFGELALPDRARLPPAVRAGLAFGAALLAHPMALTSIATGVPIYAVVFARRGRTPRAALASLALATALGGALAAFWLLPMLDNRAWMASYGWLWLPLGQMADAALHGHFTHNMPTAVGACVGLGLVVAALRPAPLPRFIAAFALLQWLMASQEMFWWFRLDRLSEGFTHLQYQRFLTVAKPGLFLAAGLGVATLARIQHDKARYLGLGLSTALLVWVGVDQVNTLRSRVPAAMGLGAVQTQRSPGHDEVDADYRAFLEWARTRHEQEPDARFAIQAGRNRHWFMDAPVHSGISLYKQGFTPGDNFVHKPETGRATVLDQLGIRYLVQIGVRARSARNAVANFGSIAVLDRGVDWRAAHLDGDGILEATGGSLEDGELRFRLSETSADSQLVFHVAGYPRWAVEIDGQPVEWHEVAITGTARATQAERRAGVLRGGKARGDDGSEPTLMAIPARDGTVVLRYRTWTGVDILGLALSLLAICAVVVWVRRPKLGVAVDAWVARAAGPRGIAIAAIVVLGIGAARWTATRSAESTTALGWVESGAAAIEGRFAPHPLKTDMLLRPAVVLRGQTGTHVATFSGVATDTVTGWYALDDDAAQAGGRGHHRILVEARALAPSADDPGEWHRLVERKVAHRPGRVNMAFDLATSLHSSGPTELRVTITSRGKAPPFVGFNFDLGDPPA